MQFLRMQLTSKINQTKFCRSLLSMSAIIFSKMVENLLSPDGRGFERQKRDF